MLAMTVMTVKHKSEEHGKKTASARQYRKGKPLQFYADDALIAQIDDWRAAQRPVLTRSDAIRRLLGTSPDLIQALTEVALKAEGKKGGKR
jgi:hypothetical protein